MTAPAVTADLSDAFFKELARHFGAQAFNLLSVWQSESGLRASAHNPNGNASGLCQLMPSIAKGLGWDPSDCTGPTALTRYRQLDAAAQLAPWVERYYAPWLPICDSPELWYLATFLPAYLLRPKAELTGDLVLAAEGGPLGWAYEANAVFDQQHTGRITLGDLGDAVLRNGHGARYAEAEARLAGVLGVPPIGPAAPPETYDLRTVSGLEAALTKLRTASGSPYYPGPLDGYSGPLLRGAIAAFQTDHRLHIDGIPGTETRGAISSALAAAGA